MTPLRNLVLVERLPGLGVRRVGTELVSVGGIILPQSFARKHPTDKHMVQPDIWRGRIEAVGPRAAHELATGDEVLVHTWAENGRGLYTGTDADTGERATPQSHRIWLEYPEDILCAVESEALQPGHGAQGEPATGPPFLSDETPGMEIQATMEALRRGYEAMGNYDPDKDPS